ncbi:3-hydroxyacyl-CoA dehydrogenase NAD-binding domain-containing protein [Pseudomonas juntendi]|uniref:3-hydroxyacyl-CoA dehydrogenase family protein n=1 Tax=Pseudomonas TaxID=286 RepID=UPI0034D51F8B
MKIGVIGKGTMGRGIVQLLSQSETVNSVLWLGRSGNIDEQPLLELKRQWERLAAKQRITPESAKNFVNKIELVNDFESLKNCTAIIEAVSEDKNAKKSIFTELGKIVSSDTILASNTSSFSITELASYTPFPGNVIGLHFFNPAPVMKLTEVISGIVTSQSTVEWSIDFASKMGKEPVLVNEAPGFIVNRMLIPMINEGIGILAEGVASALEIDKAMKYGANHPIGPLALADLIGNDVCLSIMETLHDETGDPKYRAHPLLRKMVRANRLGRKTGFGFFKY